jgi:hypothetical protein
MGQIRGDLYNVVRDFCCWYCWAAHRAREEAPRHSVDCENLNRGESHEQGNVKFCVLCASGEHGPHQEHRKTQERSTDAAAQVARVHKRIEI